MNLMTDLFYIEL